MTHIGSFFLPIPPFTHKPTPIVVPATRHLGPIPLIQPSTVEHRSSGGRDGRWICHPRGQEIRHCQSPKEVGRWKTIQVSVAMSPILHSGFLKYPTHSLWIRLWFTTTQIRGSTGCARKAVIERLPQSMAVPLVGNLTWRWCRATVPQGSAINVTHRFSSNEHREGPNGRNFGCKIDLPARHHTLQKRASQ
jgi:hypothetical protein